MAPHRPSGPGLAWLARPTPVRKAVLPLAVILLGSPALGGSLAGANNLVCNGKWHLQPASDLHDLEFLQAVSTLSVSDAWAVGSFADGTGPLTPLFQRWDGG